MNYNTTIEEVLNSHGRADIVSFMFYAQPGIRDMAILNEGITDIYRGKYYINLTEIDDDLAEMYDTARGWKLTFMFIGNISEHNMADWLSAGLDSLRVNFKLVEAKEVIQNV